MVWPEWLADQAPSMNRRVLGYVMSMKLCAVVLGVYTDM